MVHLRKRSTVHHPIVTMTSTMAATLTLFYQCERGLSRFFVSIHLTYFNPSGSNLHITVRKRSCGKVMFLQMSVSHSGRHPSGQTLPLDRNPLGSHIPQADTSPRQTHPPGRHAPDTSVFPRRPLQRTVRILLECILVVTNCVSISLRKPFSHLSFWF